jgi:hypothetical protein
MRIALFSPSRKPDPVRSVNTKPIENIRLLPESFAVIGSKWRQHMNLWLSQLIRWSARPAVGALFV